MVKVLGPNNIPITPPAGSAPTRSSAAAFGTPQGDTLQQAGKALQNVGMAGQRLADQRQALDFAARG